MNAVALMLIVDECGNRDKDNIFISPYDSENNFT